MINNYFEVGLIRLIIFVNTLFKCFKFINYNLNCFHKAKSIIYFEEGNLLKLFLYT